MAFRYILTGSDTGLDPSDITNAFRTGLVNCNSPMFSSVTYDDTGSEDFYEFVPYNAADSSLHIKLYMNSGDNKGIHVPNKFGTNRRWSNIGSNACLRCYFTWTGGAYYQFTTDSSGADVNGGLMLIFVKAQDNSPFVISVHPDNSYNGFNAESFTTMGNHLAMCASIREVDDTIHYLKFPWRNDMTQATLLPFTANPDLGQSLYTPNAFYLFTGPRINPTTTNWRLMDIENETYLTNTYFAFREERSQQ